MSEWIDLRSDTLTRPTQGMMEAMFQAKVGDDVYGEDPTVNELQEYVADLFGKEAALFCPSGTMCNQIAIRIQTRPQDQVICDQWAHVYLYEGGGIAANSHCSVKLLAGNRGRLNASQVQGAINPEDVHFPRTSLVALENTSNKGGGSCYPLADIVAIRELCDKHGLSLHLDGARVFNALVAQGHTPQQMGEHFDTLSICLSKGLGAPVGSLLLGSESLISEALRVRKMFGGGMRQAGYLAAAGLYALQNQVSRLSDDHRRAQAIGMALLDCPWVAEVLPVETNIVVFQPDPKHVSRAELVSLLADAHIKVSAFGENYVRMVTHLDLSESQIERIIEQLDGLPIPV